MQRENFMRMRCGACGHIETTAVNWLFIAVVSALLFAAFAAWMCMFLFAGNRFVMLLLLVGSGGIFLAVMQGIVRWFFTRGHKCPACGACEWTAHDDRRDDDGRDAHAREALGDE